MDRSIMPFPMRDLRELFGADLFDFGTGTFGPSIDVYQDKENVIVEMDLPRIEPEKVNITVENDVLSVSGETEEKREVKREDYYRKESRSGRFSRSLVLPMPVKNAEAEATYEKGVLKIRLPKDEAAKPKQISIKVSQ